MTFISKLLTFLGFCPSKESAQRFRVRNKITLEQSVVGVGFILILILLVNASNIYASARENILMFLGSLATIVLGILVWKKSEPPRRLVELAQVDISAPLKGRELLLNNKGILKLAYRWGVLKTFFLFWLLYVSIVGGSLYTLSIWGMPFSTRHIVYYTFNCSAIVTIMTYRQITRALRARS
jgi:hypothetical protein